MCGEPKLWPISCAVMRTSFADVSCANRNTLLKLYPDPVLQSELSHAMPDAEFVDGCLPERSAASMRFTPP